MELTVNQSETIVYDVTDTLDTYTLKGKLKLKKGVVKEFVGSIYSEDNIEVVVFGYYENNGFVDLNINRVTPENLSILMPKIEDLIIAIKTLVAQFSQQTENTEDTDESNIDEDTTSNDSDMEETITNA